MRGGETREDIPVWVEGKGSSCSFESDWFHETDMNFLRLYRAWPR